ncbi:MAG: ABC transporter permease, partial [Chloroflexota bacterium]
MANVAIPRPLPGFGIPGVAQVRQALQVLRRYPIVPAAILLLLLVGPAIFANYVAPHDPLDGNLSKRLRPPVWAGEQVVNGVVVKKGGTWEHILGTDKIGRDVLSRIIHGARVSLVVASICIFFSALIGISLGLVAGYFGGWWDHIIMRVVDIKLSLQAILLALVLAAALGPGFLTVIIVIVLIFWTRYARLVRGETLALKHQDFVARSKVNG